MPTGEQAEGRTASHAARSFLESRRAEVAVIVRVHSKASPIPDASGSLAYSLTVNGGGPFDLRARAGGRITLRLAMAFGAKPTPAGRWEASTQSYFYRLADSDGREILAYHLHPWQADSAFPHLHVSAESPGNRLRKAHLPTGDVRLADFLAMLIRDLDIPPLTSGWRRVLGV